MRVFAEHLEINDNAKLEGKIKSYINITARSCTAYNNIHTCKTFE